jgi:co-chaperonin GroES (HSP10)
MSHLPMPYKDRVLIRRDEIGNQALKSGLIVVQKDEGDNCHGTVLAVGSEAVEGLVPDMRVLYPKYGVMQINVDGQKLDLVKEADLIAVENPKE